MTQTPNRVLLVGFMASGKTQVGQRLAARLGWTFLDFDQQLHIRTGLSIPEIFREHGETHFREAEALIASELLGRRNVVLASGGGWPAAMGRMESLPAGTLSVWLRVSPEEALRRAREEGPTRPLLGVPNPLEQARALLKEREEYYRKADVVLDSDTMGIEALAGAIEILVNEKAGTRVPPFS